LSEENSDYATRRRGKRLRERERERERGGAARSTFRRVRRLRGRKIDENRARQETRRWMPTGAAGVARERRWMEDGEGRGGGGRRWEGVAHARVG